MTEQTTVTPAGTQVTQRKEPVVPNLNMPCQAIITTQVVICQPMTDGTWRLLSSFRDNYNLVLDDHGVDKTRREVVTTLSEIKEKWKKEDRLISLENLLIIGRPNTSSSTRTESQNSLKTEVRPSSDVPDAKKS